MNCNGINKPRPWIESSISILKNVWPKGCAVRSHLAQPLCEAPLLHIPEVVQVEGCSFYTLHIIIILIIPCVRQDHLRNKFQVDEIKQARVLLIKMLGGGALERGNK